MKYEHLEITDWLVSPKQIASYAQGCKTRGETDMQHAVLGLLTSMRISDVVKGAVIYQ